MPQQISVEVTDPPLRRYTYDPTGNLTEQIEGQATTSYAYDPEHRLTQVALRTSDSELRTGSYAYDGQGRRVSVTEGGITTKNLYDGLLPLMERQGSTTTATNVWGLSYGGGIGGLLARTTPTGTLYPLYDGSGNILAWTNASGAVVSSATYTAFGEIVSQSGPTQPFGFSTKPTTSTGMVYFGARYYRPDLARWLTTDPLGLVDGPNVYLFVGNNPVNVFDPFGLKKRGWWDEWLWESVVPGPYGQPISEWGPSGPTEWGDPLKYTEAAGGAWKWGERVAIGTAATATAIAVASGTGGFARGGWLNNNPYLRIGWGWKGTARAGKEVFRISIGGRNLPIWWHIPWW